MRQIRLLPLVVLAVGALFVLKSIGFVVHADNPISPIAPALAQDEAENGQGADAAAGDGTPRAGESALPEDDSVSRSRTVSLDEPANAETAILERLGERREELDKRASELDLREQLLSATEARLERRLSELKAIEERIKAAEETRHKKETEQLAGLVTMYETMKPRDAARVFDRLGLDILVGVVRQMKPRKMSAILAEMSPDAAERLTIALATDSTEEPEAAPQNGELPKIEGKPTN